MISRFGLAISRVFERTAPDPFVIAIGLTIVTAILALVFGDHPPDSAELRDRAERVLDAWRGSDGIWSLLTFSMQMCLILVTGHALAVTRPVRALIDAVASRPGSTASAAAMVSFIACAAALINWGLGLIVGALLARATGRSLESRGIRAHYPLLVAAGYMGLMVWHGGLSGSAPLKMTTATDAAEILNPQALARYDLFEHGVTLDRTLFSSMNLFVTPGLLAIVPLMFLLLAPRRAEDMRPMREFMPPDQVSPDPQEEPARSLPDRLDRSWAVAWLLAAPLILALGRFASTSGLGATGLNEINAAMLALGLILHGSPRSYMAAAEQGASGCAGIIIQFPLYAGIMGMMAQSALILKIATWFTSIGNQTTIPFLSFLAASIVNLFVPSGGGQWAIQGPIALEAGHQAGVDPGKMIMSVAYGDQLTNMLQPFWALPLLAITGVRARDIVGYTAVAMLAGGLWMMVGLLVL